LPAKQIENRKHAAEIEMADDQYVAAFGEWVFDAGTLPAFFSTNVIIAKPTKAP
jgi:hypothetical protein